MQTAIEYLTRTESAVRHLFDGVDSYVARLRNVDVTGGVFVTSKPFDPAHDTEFETWRLANAEKLTAAKTAKQEFIAESFALCTLCGAVLQVAAKALEIYSENTDVPTDWDIVRGTSAEKFCVGRKVRTVPLGLIIYAARNQHTHFNKKKLNKVSTKVFNTLAEGHGYKTPKLVSEPAFDISKAAVTSYASNVMALIEWRSYDQYAKDIRALI